MSKRRFWTEGLGSFIIAIAIALLVRWAFMEAYVIPSGSMLPTLLVRDHIFVNKVVYGVRVPFTERWIVRLNEPQPGEVVVFKYPQDISQFYIKRVVGVSGDRIFYENGNLYVNERLVEKRVPQKRAGDAAWLRDADFLGEEASGAVQNYVHWEESLGERTYSTLLRKGEPVNLSFGPYTVPEGHFFVLGDNRDNSQDSRAWGEDKRFVPRDHLVGRAMFVWLSCEQTLPVLTFLCHPFHLRWGRFFHRVQ